mgnify:CR=1 FL=1
MSHEPETVRFPRVVWDDFAMRAALCGLTACFLWFTVAIPHLSGSLEDVPALIICPVAGLVVAVALHLLAYRVSTRYRRLGLAVLGSTLLFAGLGLMAVTGQAWPVSFGLFSVGLFLSLPSLAPKLLVLPAATEHEPDLLARARQFQTRYTTVFTYVGLAANVPPVATRLFHAYGGTIPDVVAPVAFWYMVVLSAAVCVWCWMWFTRPLVELCLEPVARLLYRVQARGAERLPPFGPCLVIANHAFWFDPCILGVVLPRPITPIMTQRFYDQWFLKPLLKGVFRVIVVPETPIKRETPELDQAVAALDRGEVVVIFPEGYLRRKEETPLRRFGQGVWRILSARPDTPVVACWVEGGWGSKFSYKDGPPTKNKPMDFRRPIHLAVSAPVVVPPGVLADQMATRVHLMNRVAEMRTALGLSPLPPFEVTRVEGHEEPA